MKLCDLGILQGNDFISRFAFHFISKYEVKINNAIKRTAKGMRPSPNSLIFVGNTVAKEILNLNISSSKFKKYAKDILNGDDDLVSIFNQIAP